MYIDTGATPGSGQPTSMAVSPDKLLQLAQGLESQVENITTWLRQHHLDLAEIPPPGNDPCSRDTMAVLSQNGKTAVEAAEAYLLQLRTMANKMQESAASYGLLEDATTVKFRQEPA